jgi:1-acyl-sn-glycerol-3-phosphate acyltransferase
VLTELGVAKLWGEHPERAWTFMRYWAAPAAHWLAPGYTYGIERLPAEGGGVVAANHFNEIDPAILGAHSRRTLYYMAKIELLSIPIAGELLRWTGAFAVRRGEGDRDSIRVARWAASAGHMVGIFMEGTRQKLPVPGRAHPGAAMVAINEGVPLIPCGMDTFGWTLTNRRRSAVVWGEPIDVSAFPRTGRGYKEASLVLEQEVHRLWRQAAEAVAAGCPETLPDGTPRGNVGVRRFISHPELEAWPTDEWAEGPLGPVFPGR